MSLNSCWLAPPPCRSAPPVIGIPAPPRRSWMNCRSGAANTTSQSSPNSPAVCSWNKFLHRDLACYVVRRGCRLSALSVPDRTGRLVIEALAPDHLRGTLAVDGEAEVVSEGEAETIRQDVVVASHRPGELALGVPRGAAVGGTAVVGVPERKIQMARFRCSCVHPRDAHVARRARDHCRKRMPDAPRHPRPIGPPATPPP